MLAGAAAPTLRDRIRRGGPIPFAEFQRVALDAFFAAGHGAGRAGRDFVTSPEVGTLFGALVARGLDEAWDRLGAPDPFVVVDAGGGRGRLLADVLRARPACTPALRAVLVERSPVLRAEARILLPLEPAEVVLGPFAPGDPDAPAEPVRGSGPVVTALSELPAATYDGVIVANELLDDLPVRIVERLADGWMEVRVALAPDDEHFVELLVPAAGDLTVRADELTVGTPVRAGDRLPLALAAEDWLAQCGQSLRHGEVWIIDYAAPVRSVLARGPSGPRGWLRTYRQHGFGTDPLDTPGDQDLTCDLVLEALRRAAHQADLRVRDELDQADWLRILGLDALVEEGRRGWAEGAHRGDLRAVAARSHVVEAAALTDPSGLGRHQVVLLERP
ncbi:MAG TPA: class I SAM-dependent methyltransferase [Acidimicrobiia bacterium]|nr:class I SAM-dependent methyltransferase [Acidimicrobiia bacterium]